jgi:prepilin-type N-terminal cleavage/methylation domain-containing protein
MQYRSSTRKRSARSGFSLVEVMMVVVMIGILSTLAGTAWLRYVKRSRTSEAVGHLQKMWAGALAYYEADHSGSTGAMLDKQFPGDCTPVVEPDCCTNLDGRCKGSDPVFMQEPWKSIAFNISDKHLYRPQYTACPDPKKNMIAEAFGDLDCDGIPSRFIRRADVQPNGDVGEYGTPAVMNETE